jgi:hypothetical protein
MGLKEKPIVDVKKQLLASFKQSSEDKMKISQSFSKYFNGYKGSRSMNVSHGESMDVKESVCGPRWLKAVSADRIL